MDEDVWEDRGSGDGHTVVMHQRGTNQGHGDDRPGNCQTRKLRK